jgi:hypothetical protein
MSHVSVPSAPSRDLINLAAPLPPAAPPDYDEVRYNSMATPEERMQKFAQLASRYEISHQFASRLRQLEGYEIVFLCDDSGSMSTVDGKLYRRYKSFQFLLYIF